MSKRLRLFFVLNIPACMLEKLVELVVKSPCSKFKLMIREQCVTIFKKAVAFENETTIPKPTNCLMTLITRTTPKKN